jgi:hypothetical protein
MLDKIGGMKLGDGGRLCVYCTATIQSISPKIKFEEQTESSIQELIAQNKIEQVLLQNAKDNATQELVARIEEEQIKNKRAEEIAIQIEALQIENQFFGKKEIKELPNILSVSENVDNLITGIYNSNFGILVSTNHRLIFVDKGFIYGLKVEDFPLDKITSIEYETGFVSGEVTIHTSSNIAKIRQVDKVSARKFAEFVREKLSKPKENPSIISAQPDILGQIEKLAKLKDAGILSEEEFVEQKKKMLEKL